MNKNNIGIVLVISVLISFISGAIGGIIISSTNDSGVTSVIKTNSDIKTILIR